MKFVRSIAIAIALAAPLPLMASPALAFCGMIEATGEAKNRLLAVKRAQKQAILQLKPLRKQHGRNLVVDEMVVDCLGGAQVFMKNGRLNDTPATCLALQAYCVKR